MRRRPRSRTETGLAVYLDFADAINATDSIPFWPYGNLFEMYEKITGDDPTMPMRIYPAVHYTMGGLWVDYELATNIPRLYAAGEANFSDHGANRLGASALMQGLSSNCLCCHTPLATSSAKKSVPVLFQPIRRSLRLLKRMLKPASKTHGNPELTKCGKFPPPPE
ncbi:MAG: FAD-binding protein [Saprospiraceae bacterium]